MTCLLVFLLAGLCLWFAIMHLLNSQTPAGELARQFTHGLIEKAVGNGEGLEPEDEEDEEGPGEPQEGRTLLSRVKKG